MAKTRSRSRLAGLAGCATSPQPKAVADLMKQVKSGMTKDQVVAVAGQPKSRAVENDGAEAWQYRQTAKAYEGQKTAMNVLSFGMATMAESPMQDILTVTFTNGAVARMSYQENVNMAATMQSR